MIAAHPDRRMRPLHRPGRHGAAFELEDAAAVVDLRLGPQRLDELDAFAEPPDAVFRRNLELDVVLRPTQSNAEVQPLAKGSANSRAAPLALHPACPREK